MLGGICCSLMTTAADDEASGWFKLVFAGTGAWSVEKRCVWLKCRLRVSIPLWSRLRCSGVEMPSLSRSLRAREKSEDAGDTLDSRFRFNLLSADVAECF